MQQRSELRGWASSSATNPLLIYCSPLSSAVNYSERSSQVRVKDKSVHSIGSSFFVLFSKKNPFPPSLPQGFTAATISQSFVSLNVIRPELTYQESKYQSARLTQSYPVYHPGAFLLAGHSRKAPGEDEEDSLLPSLQIPGKLTAQNL